MHCTPVKSRKKSVRLTRKPYKLTPLSPASPTHSFSPLIYPPPYYSLSFSYSSTNTLPHLSNISTLPLHPHSHQSTLPSPSVPPLSLTCTSTSFFHTSLFIHTPISLPFLHPLFLPSPSHVPLPPSSTLLSSSTLPSVYPSFTLCSSPLPHMYLYPLLPHFSLHPHSHQSTLPSPSVPPLSLTCTSTPFFHTSLFIHTPISLPFLHPLFLPSPSHVPLPPSSTLLSSSTLPPVYPSFTLCSSPLPHMYLYPLLPHFSLHPHSHQSTLPSPSVPPLSLTCTSTPFFHTSLFIHTPISLPFLHPLFLPSPSHVPLPPSSTLLSSSTLPSVYPSFTLCSSPLPHMYLYPLLPHFSLHPHSHQSTLPSPTVPPLSLTCTSTPFFHTSLFIHTPAFFFLLSTSQIHSLIIQTILQNEPFTKTITHQDTSVGPTQDALCCVSESPMTTCTPRISLAQLVSQPDEQ